MKIKELLQQFSSSDPETEICFAFSEENPTSDANWATLVREDEDDTNAMLVVVVLPE